MIPGSSMFDRDPVIFFLLLKPFLHGPHFQLFFTWHRGLLKARGLSLPLTGLSSGIKAYLNPTKKNYKNSSTYGPKHQEIKK